MLGLLDLIELENIKSDCKGYRNFCFLCWGSGNIIFLISLWSMWRWTAAWLVSCAHTKGWALCSCMSAYWACRNQITTVPSWLMRWVLERLCSVLPWCGKVQHYTRCQWCWIFWFYHEHFTYPHSCLISYVVGVLNNLRRLFGKEVPSVHIFCASLRL